MARPFRLFGFPVRVRPSFLILVAILGIGGGSDPVRLLAWVAIAFVSILLHELGHAGMGRAFGFSSSIEFGALGGLTSFGPVKLTPGRDVLISLAGPAVSITLGLLLLRGRLLLVEGSFADDVMADAVFANLGWGLFNLCPVLPLDGGHALRGLLELIRFGDAELITRVVSLVTLTAMVVYLVMVGADFWSFLFLANFAFANVRGLQTHLATRGPTLPGDTPRGQPRSLWLRWKLFFMRRGGPGVKIDLEPLKRPRPPLRVVTSLDEELAKRRPPKDKRFLN